jgi:hypothetical protein
MGTLIACHLGRNIKFNAESFALAWRDLEGPTERFPERKCRK